MSKDRSHITVRIVPLHSSEAGDSRMGGTVAERVQLVADLTKTGWILAKLPFPTYSRATMPASITTLAAQGEDD